MSASKQMHYSCCEVQLSASSAISQSGPKPELMQIGPPTKAAGLVLSIDRAIKRKEALKKSKLRVY